MSLCKSSSVLYFPKPNSLLSSLVFEFPPIRTPILPWVHPSHRFRTYPWTLTFPLGDSSFSPSTRRLYIMMHDGQRTSHLHTPSHTSISILIYSTSYSIETPWCGSGFMPNPPQTATYPCPRPRVRLRHNTYMIRPYITHPF